MAYDIYGNNLRRGYCEVHPNVPEEYPCSICLADSNRKHQDYQADSLRRQNAQLQSSIDQLKQENEKIHEVLADVYIELSRCGPSVNSPAFPKWLETRDRVKAILNQPWSQVNQ